ncbi:MAG: hypothetical protein AAF703_21090 [Cyanobacteria bacterium P01_D01_bin.105]
MKIIQFIHPMFLTALGLHASLLFVPIGGDSGPELLEEDVPIAELTADARRAASSPTPDKLPVPDPNVNAGTAKPGQVRANSASPSAIVRSNPGPSSVPAKVAAPTAQTAATGALAASGSGRAASSNSVSSGNASGGSAAQDPSNVITPAVSSAPEQSTSFIPDLSAEETDATNRTAVGENDANIPLKSARLAALMAALPRESVVSTSLEASVLALQEALLYRPEGTTDDDAEQMRAAWISAVSRQANSAGNVESIEPTVQDDFVLAYPMASSVLRNGRSLNVCLDKKPSNAEVGLRFDADGKLAVEPQILRSTGYEALNLELIAMLENEENFPGAGEASAQENRNSKAYIYEIELSYDAEKCVNLSELQS